MLLKLFALQFGIGAILCYTTGYTFLLERNERTIMNDNYLKDVRNYIRRNNRQSPYYLHMEGTILHTWNNNITIVIDFKEKRSNMYHPSFMNFRFGLCNMVSKDYIFGTMLKQSGFICPAPPGHYKLHNLTIHMEKFPSVMPLEKGRAQVSAVLTNTNEPIYQEYIYFSIVKLKNSDKKTKALSPEH